MSLKHRHARRAGNFFVNKKPLEVANGAYQSIVISLNGIGWNTRAKSAIFIGRFRSLNFYYQ